MADDNKTLAEVHARLGYHPLGSVWAKLEILFGLGAAGMGILVGIYAVSRAVELTWAAAGLALFVLGWYLALAGHRSHLYRSLNSQTSILLEEIRRASDHQSAGIKSDEHSRR